MFLVKMRSERVVEAPILNYLDLFLLRMLARIKNGQKLNPISINPVKQKITFGITASLIEVCSEIWQNI
jgi:hypothetical protein